MVFTEPFNMVKAFKDLIGAQDDTIHTLGIWEVTDIVNKTDDGYITNAKYNIKHINFKAQQNDVPMLGVGFGHRKGILKHPNVGDLVLVTFMDTKPFILGTLFDYITQNPDSVPQIKLNELLIVQQENGSIILMKDNNDVLIRSADLSGNFDNGARIRINADGSFKLFNKGNYGIECDASGNITIRGVTVNATQTPGTW